jgi:hypothetical protein
LAEPIHAPRLSLANRLAEYIQALTSCQRFGTGQLRRQVSQDCRQNVLANVPFKTRKVFARKRLNINVMRSTFHPMLKDEPKIR